jgi:hypothetical protein
MRSLKKLCWTAVAALALFVAVGGGTASATTLEVGGVSQNKSVSMEMTLKSGTSMLLKDEFGTTTETCTSSTMAGSTSSPFTVTSITLVLAVVRTEKCTHTDTVLALGILHFHWFSGTNASVSMSGSETTIQSTFFGASAICKTGTGTTIGTLTGTKEGNATLDVNATINCGILGSSSWTGTYTVTKVNGVAGAGLGAVN